MTRYKTYICDFGDIEVKTRTTYAEVKAAVLERGRLSGLLNSYADNKRRVHLHLWLSMEFDAGYLCAVLQWPVREIEQFDVFSRDHEPRVEGEGQFIRQELEDVHEAVLVDVLQFIEQPQGVLVRLPFESRVKWLKSANDTDCVGVNSRQVDVHLGVEPFGVNGDWKLRTAGDLPIRDDQLPDDVVQDASKIMEVIAETKGQRVGTLGLRDLDKVVTGLGIRLTNNSIKVPAVSFVEVGVHRVEVRLCSLQLQPCASQITSHALPSEDHAGREGTDAAHRTGLRDPGAQAGPGAP